MPLPTYTFAQLQAMLATQYSSQAAIPANTDAGSSLGAIFNAAAILALLIQNENVYIDEIARLATIPANADGTPSADAISFTAPWAVTPISAGASSGNITCSVPSPAAQAILIPVGGIVQTQSGLQFTVTAGGTGYNSGANGYYIAQNTSSVSVPVQCNTTGIIGNVAANTITQVFGSSTATPMPSVNVTNPLAFTNGVAAEQDAAFKARFTLQVSTGKVATKNAILAAALGTQAGLTCSFGDRVNADLSTHTAYFTLVVGLLTGAAPSNTLLTAVQGNVEAVRSAGISYQVIAPTLVPVNGAATIKIATGYSATSVLPAVAAAYDAFVNSIGLSQDTTATTCSLAKCYAALLAVPGVFDVVDLTLNSGTVDITANFANQLVAGTTNFVAG